MGTEKRAFAYNTLSVKSLKLTVFLKVNKNNEKTSVNVSKENYIFWKF